MVSFKDIETDGNILVETNRYIHYQTLNKKIQYDSNKIVYKIMPELHTFQEDEAYLKAMHEKHGQQFLKFVFPDNINLKQDLKDYLVKQGYKIGWLELYSNKEKKFKDTNTEDIRVEVTNEENFVDFLNLSYEFDQEYGEEYATLKIESNKQQFHSDNPIQVISYYRDKPSGILLIWNQEKYVELDSFAVIESYRNKGIGSKMQAFVAKIAEQRSIILVADGEDTAKDMYKKQGYQYTGFQYEILKETET